MKKTEKQPLQAIVVENNNARMAPADLPDPCMEANIVADVVAVYIRTVQFRPGKFIKVGTDVLLQGSPEMNPIPPVQSKA